MLDLAFEWTQVGGHDSSRTTEDMSETDSGYWIDADQKVSYPYYKTVVDMVEAVAKLYVHVFVTTIHYSFVLFLLYIHIHGSIF
jgi:hypothetical protein